MTRIVFAVAAIAFAASAGSATACEWGKKMSKAKDQVTMSSPYIVDGTVETITAGVTYDQPVLLPVEEASDTQVVYLDVVTE